MDDVIMVEAALVGATGSWSPHAILASIDRLTDQTSTVDRGPVTDRSHASPAVAFERALAEELQRAGGIDPFDFGFDWENGTALGRAGDIDRASGPTDRFDAGDLVGADGVDPQTSISSDRRVGFDDEDASSRLSAGGDDGFERDRRLGDRPAFWIGDRITSPPASRGDASAFVEELPIESVPTGHVFFNGDGRPIVLPSIPDVSPSIDGGGHDQLDIDDTQSADGDLMILPNGAVLAYDPWTVTVDGPLRDGTSTH